MRKATRALVLLTAAVGLSYPATAAQITQIQYDVTSGTYSGPQLSGAITGGSVTVTFPSGPVSTPGNVSSIALAVSLSGAAGAFQLAITPTGLSGGFAGNPFNAFFYYLISASPVGLSGASPVASVTNGSLDYRVGTYASPYKSTVFLKGLTTQGGSFHHVFFIGNEVRTVVPEPTTGTLLGLGLLGLAGAASRKRRLRKS